MKSRHEDDLPLSNQRPVAADVRGELEFHLEQRARDLVAQGHPPDEARRLAQEAFGDRERVEAECRKIESRRRVARHRARQLEDLRDDLRVGARLLRRSPGFTLAAVATLALGIGANTAVFSIVDDVILTPLAYEDADRLVSVAERHEGGWGNLPWSTYLELQATSRSFTAIAEYGNGTSTALGMERPLRVEEAWTSASFFTVFPVRPMLGRLPLPDEHQLGAPPVAVVSHAFWRDHLGSPASLEGIRLKLSFDHEVVGVLPPGFDFPAGTQVWTPIELIRQPESHTAHNWTSVARLRPDVSPLAAQQEVDALLARMKDQYYPDFDAVGSIIRPLQDVLTESSRKPLLLLLGASAVLLLAACTNLASAGLARGTTRAGEFAVRSALGAARRRLVRQVLTESALLCLSGTAAGLALAAVLLHLAVPLAPPTVPLDAVTIDGRVLAFTAAVAVVVTILTGLVPALRVSEASTAGVLRSGIRGTADARRARAWQVLVGAEVALAIVLLASSGLLIRSLMAVLATDIGFDPAGVLRTDVELPSVNYAATSPTVPAFHERTLAGLAAVPGVEAAGFINRLPLTGGNPSGAMEVEGKPHNPRGPFTGYAVYRVIGGDYFGAMRIPVVSGRLFGPGDDRAGPPVVIVSETFAAMQWPGEDAIGKRVRPVGMDGSDEPWHTVVGVVGDTRAASITDRFREVYYFDHRQRPPYRANSTTYVTRTAAAPMTTAAAVRRAVESVDPQVPLEQRPLETLVSQSVADRRFTVLIIGSFATVALLLAIVGIYAVVSYSVAQRTREIGVRLALGATPGRVRGLVMVGSLKSILPGVVAGGLLATGTTTFIRSMLYGVSPLDPMALGLAVLLLAAAGIASSLGPALRATRVDPLIAIRSE